MTTWTLTSGASKVVGTLEASAASPKNVWVKPAVGDTVRVRYKVAPDADYETVDSVTSFDSWIFDATVYDLEFTRTAGSGTTSTCGVA